MPAKNKDEQERRKVYRRVVDVKGRVTLPAEMRQQLGIRTGEEVEFVVREEGEWCLRKSQPQRICGVCGCTVNLIILGGEALCRRCALQYVQTLARELDLQVVGIGGNSPRG
ncbi:MAG: AbrB/MazE/SpoVT family DNA-binding domain-containing protein [Thermoanaerobacteraceae bacterium]|uniref:AbrB/MazE/SpoVT family DNA-binding domain-containing protein n=1 Tax=Thermanaeromonas sp. C210 TaxID=2731925 RepID=UPI00155CA816|nr:AbrB/MazE/SpoVT family DNA-binding domain-containing protein [Thermanaeromonas sp. C210]MBE3580376.1 AbrB/MazE/SpoVT family DNA-binding domain-containing protein [Thermoanaerobacteraceae bacterium]GFN23126.1 hypothetical protein TAMC210_14430 [Thermanaeromonas sp. C210]